MLSYLGLTGVAIEALLKVVSASGAKAAAPEELNQAKLQAEAMASIVMAQAKAQQEQAIALRIACAEEVQIEEYYDTTGKGHLGVTAKEDGITAGLAGEGRRVTKRIIKFTGNPCPEEIYQNFLIGSGVDADK
ncbi:MULTISPECIES: hypothetical protein [unclassified Pseudomonas]|uniref:hypothetical protein n=1 Tax=unclassified Pseudomonas TaxID=196821 RepID=UPI000A1E08A0|nr:MULTISPECIES: hypothetical protein [unclassified Pseudomonas]